MAKGFILSELDRDLFRQVVEAVRGEIQNTTARPRTDVEWDQGTPEVYVAKTPSAGIPARSGTTPGYAECDLFKVVGDGPYVIIEVDATYNRKVFNLNTTTVPGNQYILVVRDKFGQWFNAGENPSGMWMRVTGGTGAGPYSGTKVVLTAPGTPSTAFQDAVPSVTTNYIFRVGSNTPSPAAGTPPPDIPVNQVIWVVPSPLDPLYYETDAVGGLYSFQETVVTGLSCTGGVAVLTTKTITITSRDLTGSSV